MALTATKSKMFAGGLAAAVLLLAVVAKWQFFPGVKEDYFAMNQRNLGEVPFGLVVVRATHFPHTAHKGIIDSSAQRHGQRCWRLMGRDVSLPELIGLAYDQPSSRVVLPAEAPATNFDFLVTTASDQQQRLQAAIREKLGLVATKEVRERPVLALKVQDPALPALTPSDAGSQRAAHFEQGRLHFTKFQVIELARGLEHATTLPIVDATGLTNYYDFSVEWGAARQKKLDDAAAGTATVNEILNALGLKLEPDQIATEMLVVKKAG